MKHVISFLVLIVVAATGQAQKIDSIYFHLYTDSLKKGFYNYINVDGKTADGRWIPLSAKELRFTSNTGRFEGNDLFVDSSYTGDTVKVRAELKSNPAVSKEITIHIRKRGFTEPLKTDEEILNGMKRKRQ